MDGAAAAVDEVAVGGAAVGEAAVEVMVGVDAVDTAAMDGAVAAVNEVTVVEAAVKQR